MNRYDFADLKIGMRESFTVTVTAEMADAFYHLTADENPLHRDAEYAKAHGFSDCVVYGMLTASFLSRLAGVYLPGERSLIHSVETKFLKPVYVGDELTVSGTVRELHESVRQLLLAVEIVSGDGRKVLRGNMRIGIL